MGGVVCEQQWYADWVFSYWILIIGAYVDYMAYLPRQGFNIA
jgi:hypothetical protein